MDGGRCYLEENFFLKMYIYSTFQVTYLGDSGESFSHEQVGQGAALFHDLEASHDVALGVGKRLALLQRDQLRHLLQVLLDQGLVSGQRGRNCDI